MKNVILLNAKDLRRAAFSVAFAAAVGKTVGDLVGTIINGMATEAAQKVRENLSKDAEDIEESRQ